MNRRHLLGLLPAFLVAPLVAREKPHPVTWTASGTVPSVGNGTIAGSFNRHGDTVLPPLHGDGIHDDGPAIQARIDRFGTVRLGPGTFLIGAALSGGSIVGMGADSTVLRYTVK